MTNPETPSTNQAGGPSLDDVYKLCEEFEFHFEGDTDESLKTLHGMINTALTRWGWRSSAALEANSRAAKLQRLLALLVDFLCLSGYGVSPEAWRQVCLLSGRHCEPFLSKSLKAQPSTKKPNPSDKEIDLLWDDVGMYYKLYTQARALVRAALDKWGVSTTTSAIRAALEGLVAAYAACRGQYEEYWPDYLDEPMVRRAQEALDYGIPATPPPLKVEDEQIEAAAKLIYASMRFAATDSHGVCDWVERGNSLMQDEARRTARAVLNSQDRPVIPAAPPAPAPEPDDAWWYELVNEIARVQHIALGKGQGPRFDLAEAVRRWYQPTPPALPAPESGELVAWLKEEAESYRNTCGTNLASQNLDNAATLLLEQGAELTALREVPVAGISDEHREAVREAVAKALGEAYDCQRVWTAWSYGTMGPDDFTLTAEDDDRVAEIADAAIEVIGNFAMQTEVTVSEQLQIVKAGIRAGYNLGRHHTVEGGWGDPDEVADDIAQDTLDSLDPLPAPQTGEAQP